jgi:hypothetical protein
MKRIPESITVNTGDQHQVVPLIDQFMAETLESVKKAIEAHDHDFKVESGEVSDGPNHVSNDRVTYLRFKDQVVALVMETRTELNHVRYDFFRDMRGLR